MKLGKSLAAMPSSGIRDTFNLIVGKPDIINLAPGEPNFPTPPSWILSPQNWIGWANN